MYVFITSDKVQYEQNETVYHAVSETKIATINYSDTYTSFGQGIDHDDAGDWATIKKQEAVEKINQWLIDEEIDRKVSVDETLYAYEERNELFRFAIGLEGVELEYVTVKGFNYWDGHNHASVIVEADWDTNYSLENDEEINAFLNRAIEGMQETGRATGAKYYTFIEGERQANITESFWQGQWAEYKITITEVDEA